MYYSKNSIKYLFICFIFCSSCAQQRKQINKDSIIDVTIKDNKIFVFLKDQKIVKFTSPFFLDAEFELNVEKNSVIKIHEYDTNYGNYIDLFFNYSFSDSTLYLKKIDAFFPFKQDTLGRNKYCTMDNLNLDIRTIDSEQLFDEFNTDKYCELKKDK
ncbi:hypothetical protein [Aquimarina aquimarini]|uniref:hypothetical protein n=1 Tax=Aquimarina aquimarini TaxID=1191734 RepID=UPI000D55146E|nr:hypothetical protein [Aquimarina aquimarini]